MMKITCFCVLTMIARTLAQNETACCPPSDLMSFKKVEGKAVCYTPDSNHTSPTNPDCEFGYNLYYYNEFIFKENGLVDINGTELKDISKYCINDVKTLQTNSIVKVGIVCYDEPDAEINAYALIISVVFLILTLIIYSILSEIRDLLNICFINLCGSLAIGLCLLAITSFMSTDAAVLTGMSLTLCAARGFFAYFFLLVSFFWTTAISIQLTLTIRSPIFGTRDWKTFAWFALCAWGFPAIITMCMAIVNFLPGDHSKPAIGVHSCWFNPYEKIHLWYWLYSVLTILAFINLTIFIYIFHLFCRTNFASTKVTIKYRICLTLKLFIVMGLFWIIEILVTLIDYQPSAFWKTLNVVTSLQGVWIFLVLVVFRKRVVQAMYDRGWLAYGPIEKHLTVHDEINEDNIQHTAVPMTER